MIDVETITTAWLNAADLAAPVAGRQPETLDGPWVRLTLIDARSYANVPVRTHGTAYLQIDCYAAADNDQVAVLDLARAVEDRLEQMPGIHDGGVVTAVVDISRRHLPDTTVQPARERYVVECVVHGHQ